MLRISGSAATEEQLTRVLPQAHYAHLATHGFFDTRGEVYQANLRQQNLSGETIGGLNATVAARNPLPGSGPPGS